ncbi:MAG: hypothetical protein RBR52_14800 [Thiomonas sp.]|uniref:hypothetical protein n=1 Tax=Thiomonas sp. TaxID=2047785 RepID=UPI002A358F35|nr:hypothetical protein [Thiomonas sp.]MDY0331745.1 hypothetical protein [Thiomonas sp.]
MENLFIAWPHPLTAADCDDDRPRHEQHAVAWNDQSTEKWKRPAIRAASFDGLVGCDRLELSTYGLRVLEL